MSYAFRLPDMGEGVTEGEVVAWLVAPGDRIEEDTPLVELDSDKAAVQVPSPVSGRVAEILVAAGSVVPVGTVLVVIDELLDGDGVGAAPGIWPGAPAEEEAPMRALPYVRRLAARRGVDLTRVVGSGADGSITLADIVQDRESERPAAGYQLHGVQRHVAERTSRAHREVPAVTVVDEVDVTALRERATGYAYFASILRATAGALRHFPRLNSTFEDGRLFQHESFDVGLAVQTRRGLMVPVVRDVGGRAPDELSAEVRRLVRSARAGRLTRDELRGSSFTVTNAGDMGGLLATPLVNVPEVAILGVHRAELRPVVRGGDILARAMCFVSCTFDHRVLEGAEIGGFLGALRKELEAPDGP